MYLIKQRIRAHLFVNFALYKYLIIIITLWNALDLDIRLLPFDTFKKSVKTHLYLKYFVN